MSLFARIRHPHQDLGDHRPAGFGLPASAPWYAGARIAAIDASYSDFLVKDARASSTAPRLNRSIIEYQALAYRMIAETDMDLKRKLLPEIDRNGARSDQVRRRDQENWCRDTPRPSSASEQRARDGDLGIQAGSANLRWPAENIKALRTDAYARQPGSRRDASRRCAPPVTNSTKTSTAARRCSPSSRPPPHGRPI